MTEKQNKWGFLELQPNRKRNICIDCMHFKSNHHDGRIGACLRHTTRTHECSTCRSFEPKTQKRVI